MQRVSEYRRDTPKANEQVKKQQMHAYENLETPFLVFVFFVVQCVSEWRHYRDEQRCYIHHYYTRFCRAEGTVE